MKYLSLVGALAFLSVVIAGVTLLDPRSSADYVPSGAAAANSQELLAAGSDGGQQAAAGGTTAGTRTTPGPRDGWENGWEPTSNPDYYPWELDENTPDLSIDVSVPEYEGGSSERGDTWTLPEYEYSGLPFTEEDLTLPEFPG